MGGCREEREARGVLEEAGSTSENEENKDKRMNENVTFDDRRIVDSDNLRSTVENKTGI